MANFPSCRRMACAVLLHNAFSIAAEALVESPLPGRTCGLFLVLFRLWMATFPSASGAATSS